MRYLHGKTYLQKNDNVRLNFLINKLDNQTNTNNSYLIFIIPITESRENLIFLISYRENLKSF